MPTVASANVPMPGMAKSQPSRAEAGGAAIAKDGEPSPRAVATSIYADKHSFDYVWRSGLAGGMAGCVVCPSSFTAATFVELSSKAV